MTQKYFHGTDKESANSIVGNPNKINVELGGGELGRGFYTGNSMHIAASWAWIRSEKRKIEPGLIVFEMEDAKIAKLSVHHIKTREEVDKLHKELQDNDERRSRLFGKDYVIAPFQSIDSALQYKFESKEAETIINNCKTIFLPCV